MAASYKFICDTCGFQVISWDDGNPYIQGKGRKRYYFYHPGDAQQLENIGETLYGRKLTNEEINQMLKERAGNAPDHICMNCGKIVKLDPNKDEIICKNCKSKQLMKTLKIGNKPCPKCGGRFSAGEFNAIS